MFENHEAVEGVSMKGPIEIEQSSSTSRKTIFYNLSYATTHVACNKKIVACDIF
jgi:hypothetical protein